MNSSNNSLRTVFQILHVHALFFRYYMMMHLNISTIYGSFYFCSEPLIVQQLFEGSDYSRWNLIKEIWYILYWSITVRKTEGMYCSYRLNNMTQKDSRKLNRLTPKCNCIVHIASSMQCKISSQPAALEKLHRQASRGY